MAGSLTDIAYIGYMHRGYINTHLRMCKTTQTCEIQNCAPSSSAAEMFEDTDLPHVSRSCVPQSEVSSHECFIVHLFFFFTPKHDV